MYTHNWAVTGRAWEQVHAITKLPELLGQAEHRVVASNAHVCFPDILIAPKQGAMFQPLGLVGLFLFVFFKFSSWSTVLHWWVVLVGSFTSLVYQKPEGSSLCALGRDFSELEVR